MSERDEGDKKRFAVFIPIGIGRENGNIVLESLGLSSDRESAEQAAIKYSDDMGADSWSLQEIRPDGSTGDRKFYFSGATWKAPWQPTGPKPNWKTEANPSEPIN